GVGGGEVDDPPPARRLHMGQGVADAVDAGAEVDGDDPVPHVHRELIHRRHMLDTGVVDQDIHAPEGPGGGGDQIADLVRAGHVGAVEAGGDAEVHLDGAANGLDGVRVAKAV